MTPLVRTLLFCVSIGIFGLSEASVADTNVGQAMSPEVSWGNPDQPWGRRRPISAADRAVIAGYRSAAKNPAIEEAFTDPAELGARWRLQSDDNTNLKSCRRPANVVIAAIVTNGAIKGSADVRFSTAVMDYAGKIPANPAGHHMYVRRLRVIPDDPAQK